MSKQQQPKEYIITEEELDHFVTCSSKNDCVDCKYSAPEFQCTPRIMANKIRSRPHPAPQAPVKMGEISKICKLCHYETDCKEHDAALIRKAREDVLDEIAMHGNYLSINALSHKDWNHEMRKYIQSLRQQQGDQEQPR